MSRANPHAISANLSDEESQPRTEAENELLLAPPLGSGVVYPRPEGERGDILVTDGMHQHRREGYPISETFTASFGALTDAGAAVEMLRQEASGHADESHDARRDRAIVGAIRNLWRGLQLLRELLRLWNDEIASLRGSQGFTSPLGQHKSCAHAVCDLGEQILAEMWGVGWKANPLDTWDGDWPFKEKGLLPRFQVDWWYGVLPALREHFSQRADPWGLSEERSCWEIGLRSEAEELRRRQPPTQTDVEAARFAAQQCLLELNALVRAVRSSDEDLLPVLEDLQKAVGCRPPIQLLVSALPLPDAIHRCLDILARKKAISHAGLTASCAHQLVIALGARALTTALGAIIFAGEHTNAEIREMIRRKTRELWSSECQEPVRAALASLPAYDADRLASEFDVEYSRAQRRLREHLHAKLGLDRGQARAGLDAELPTAAPGRPNPAVQAALSAPEPTPTQARDEWIYHQKLQGRSFKEIRADLKRIATERGWEPFADDSGVWRALRRWCHENNREPPGK